MPKRRSRSRHATTAPRHIATHWPLSTVLLLAIAGVVALVSLDISGKQSGDSSPHALAANQNAIPTATVPPIPTPAPAQPPSKLVVPAPTQIALPDPPPPPQPVAYANEVGQILILEYHVFTTNPEQEGQWVRTLDDFRADLNWLYENNFYVVPLRDIFLNQIAAPPGKHPVALTFDDGTAGQFRLLPQADGSLRVDPNSAVGVLEEMFTQHPDFGRGGHFAVLPYNCFHFPDEPDQIPYCEAKLRWLEAHGYEVGNHTDGHTDLLDVNDEDFKSTIVGVIDWARDITPGADTDILTMPFGNYPDPKKHPEQWRWLREGFEYEGRQVRLLGALMVNGGPAHSPVSVHWDPLQVPRIQAFDEMLANTWAYVEENRHLLYTSDGDPNTITVLNEQPAQLQGAFDPGKANGRQIAFH